MDGLNGAAVTVWDCFSSVPLNPLTFSVVVYGIGLFMCVLSDLRYVCFSDSMYPKSSAQPLRLRFCQVSMNFKYLL